MGAKNEDMSTAWRKLKKESKISMFRRVMFNVIHLVWVLIYTVYILRNFNGVSNNDSFQKTINFRQIALISCAWVYFARVVITQCYILLGVRQVSTEELISVAVIFYPLIYATFGLKLLINTNVGEFEGVVDVIAIIFYIFGSFLNTYSELQRKWFKTKAENKGKLFVHGLYRLSRHPNYLGDSILFAGWGLLTWQWWNLWVSCIMTIGFLTYHIPGLEKYLKERYSNQWIEYELQVAPFIPFVMWPNYESKKTV